MNQQMKHKQQKKKKEELQYWNPGEVKNTEEHHQSQATSMRERIPEKVLHNNKVLQLEKNIRTHINHPTRWNNGGSNNSQCVT
jgi:hypothetical protein